MISTAESVTQIILHCFIATVGFIMLVNAHPSIDYIMILLMTIMFQLIWGMVAFTLYTMVLIDFHYRYFRGFPPIIDAKTRDILYSRGIYGFGYY